MVASAAGSRSPGAAIVQQGQISSAADELEIASSLILEVVNSGFAALRLQVQTLEERRTLLAKYGQATRQLRKALMSCSSSEAVFFPVLLFALYEMIVNLDPEDKTWHTHLDGLLSLVSRSPVSSTTFYLHKALKLVESRNELSNDLSGLAVTGDPSVAYLLLDVTKLRLRKILPDILSLFKDTLAQPRKIDVQKFRVSIKKIYVDLELFSNMISRAGNDLDMDGIVNTIEATSNRDILIMRLNEYRTLRIMIASFLLWTRDFLSKDEGYTHTRESSNLCTVTEDAASGIRSTTESYIIALSTGTGQQFQNATALFIRTSMLLFPLYCKARLIERCAVPQLRMDLLI
ncbi:hypothetical protein E8E14_013713 [Neopestalotiopsis sp. 37M]|nr:hypothetical protein E8E14_013713 [Neopestalotiopsis sp. 37M]